jgi:hypothetical protein
MRIGERIIRFLAATILVLVGVVYGLENQIPAIKEPGLEYARL